MIGEFDDQVRGIGRMTQGMFRLAGRHDLAARFRPVLQRVIRKLKATDPEAAAEAEADAPEGEGAETSATGEASPSEETKT